MQLYVLITPKWKRAPLLNFEYQLRQARRKDTVQLLFELFIEILKLCTGSNIQEADNRPLSPMMRAEVQKLDKYIEEYKFLCDNHIESPKELLSFQENLSARISELEQERYAVRQIDTIFFLTSGSPPVMRSLVMPRAAAASTS